MSRRPSSSHRGLPDRAHEPTRASQRFRPIDSSLVDADPPASGGTVELDSAPDAPQDEPPPERIGRFRILGVLGRGGMATVYRAHDPIDGGQVALKLLRPTTDDRRADRLRQEATLALGLAHPAFVRAFEQGEHEGRPYYTMEVATGPTLADVLAQQGPLAPRDAACVVARLARALDVLHERGIVHRDLKPANVVLHPTRGPVVLDLGLAKDLRAQRGLTGPGEILGTVSYMSPEQVQGGPVDARTDVYALGAILFTLVTGRPPHQGPPVVALRHILHGPAPLLGRHVPVSPSLEAACRAALARDPGLRPASALAFAQALERVCADPRRVAPAPSDDAA
ncbi:MAG: serine/threonine protein kinase [Planctomycetes bacterium]|nr:serine/threonine protein kinase [Planctomycetota bacterium]